MASSQPKSGSSRYNLRRSTRLASKSLSLRRKITAKRASSKRPPPLEAAHESAKHVMETRAARRIRRETFPFLRLPAELRSMIYEELLVTDENINLLRKTPKFHTAILRTCRLVNEEAAAILYGQNVFGAMFYTSRHITLNFFERIGPANRSRVRKIYVLEYTNSVRLINNFDVGAQLDGIGLDPTRVLAVALTVPKRLSEAFQRCDQSYGLQLVSSSKSEMMRYLGVDDDRLCAHRESEFDYERLVYRGLKACESV